LQDINKRLDCSTTNVLFYLLVVWSWSQNETIKIKQLIRPQKV